MADTDEVNSGSLAAKALPAHGEMCFSAGTHRAKEKAQWETINSDRRDNDRVRSKVAFHSCIKPYAVSGITPATV